MVGITEASVKTALASVMDTHMKASIVDIGMVRGIIISGNNDIEIRFSFPCIGCPARQIIHADIRDRLGKLDGVGSIRISDEWVNKWDPNDISDDARARAHAHGYMI